MQRRQEKKGEKMEEGKEGRLPEFFSSPEMDTNTSAVERRAHNGVHEIVCRHALQQVNV